MARERERKREAIPIASREYHQNNNKTKTKRRRRRKQEPLVVGRLLLSPNLLLPSTVYICMQQSQSKRAFKSHNRETWLYCRNSRVWFQNGPYRSGVSVRSRYRCDNRGQCVQANANAVATVCQCTQCVLKCVVL